MEDERDAIRARIDIVELVGQRVALRHQGKQYKGLCPFHEDRNPSFVVDPQTGRYKCWACGESGDIFTWVMKTEHVEFPEALRELAARAGITLQGRGGKAPSSDRELFRTAMTEALSFFQDQLSRHEHALAYCERRGLDKDTLERWEIGYAPDVGEALATLLKRKGVALSEGKKLFLVDQDASGGYYDRFRGRLMFPIRNEKGDLVAFGGRLLGDGQPKYINSSDTPLYQKGRVLYGMNRARDAFGKSRKAVLVEGYLDVIACHTAGVNTAVASLGTALSEDHARLLKRWVDGVTILYDSDEAGQKAAERAIDILEAQGLAVRVALMPKGEDPDTLLRKSGVEAVQASVGRGSTPVEFRLALLEASMDPSEEEFWRRAVEILAKARSQLEVMNHQNRLATLYPGVRDVREARDLIGKMIAQARSASGSGSADGRGAPLPTASEHHPLKEPLRSAEIVLFRALYELELQAEAWKVIVSDCGILATGSASRLAEAIAKAFPMSPPCGPSSGWLHLIEPEEVRQVLIDLPMDFRGQMVTREGLSDAVRVLARGAEARELRRLRQGDLSAEQRQELNSRLRRMNQNGEKPASEDPPASSEDPFA